MNDDKRRRISLRIPSLSFKLGRLGTFSIPKLWAFNIPLPGGIYMGGGKLIVGSLTTVSLGFIASMFVLISSGDQEITFPMLGAMYDAPSMIGSPVVDAEFPMDRSQTLQINLPPSLRVDEISFTNVSLGKNGLTNAFKISGSSTVSTLTIDDLIIRNSEFPTMDFSNSSIYKVVATSSVIVAGHTFSQTMGTSTDVVIGSGRGAVSYVAEDMVVDRIILTYTGGATSSDVIIDKVILDGVKAWTGAFDADYLDIGTLTLENIRVGNDGDINDADLVISDTVTVNSMLDGVIEAPIHIR